MLTNAGCPFGFRSGGGGKRTATSALVRTADMMKAEARFGSGAQQATLPEVIPLTEVHRSSACLRIVRRVFQHAEPKTRGKHLVFGR